MAPFETEALVFVRVSTVGELDAMAVRGERTRSEQEVLFGLLASGRSSAVAALLSGHVPLQIGARLLLPYNIRM